LFIWTIYREQKKINETCRKTMQRGIMDGGSTVYMDLSE
jgi:hypothetical protein